MKKHLKKAGRKFAGFLIVCLLVLPLWALGKTLVMTFGKLWLHTRWNLWPYVLGLGGYVLVERLAFVPLRLYVFGHELTHALSCALSGGRIYDFHASPLGGHVKLSKRSAWIALSPYCVPIYTIFLILLTRVLGVWWPVERYSWIPQALVGASLAFHVSLTLFALKCHQPDLEVLGWLPSLSVILFANGLCLAALMIYLFPQTLGTADIASVFGLNLKTSMGRAASGAVRLWHKVHPTPWILSHTS